MVRMFTRLLGLSFVAIMLAAAAAPVGAQEEFKQIKLTEKLIKGFLSSHSKLQKALEKIEKAGDTPDPKLIAELDGIAKKNGFSSFDELDSVASTISFMMTGFVQVSRMRR